MYTMSLKEKSEIQLSKDVESQTISEKSPNAPKKIYWFRSVFFQTTIVGLTAFLSPGIYNAMQSTGAAGNFTPYLVLRANTVLNTLMFVVCFSGSVIINWIGLKWSLVLGTSGYSIYAASIYQNNRYGTEWFVYIGSAACGLTAGVFWAAESSILLTYCPENKRGRYLAYWLAYRNSGSIIGGAINLALNYGGSSTGKLNWKTFIVFVVLQVVASFVALFLSPPEKVQRTDGVKLRDPPKVSSWYEFQETIKLLKSTRLLFALFFCWYATYPLSIASAYLTLHFTVRARALASLVSAISQVIFNVFFGWALDYKKVSLNKRARYMFIFMMAFGGGGWIWSTILHHEFEASITTPKFDWNSSGFAKSWVLYLWWQVHFSMMYNYVFWMLGYFTKDHKEIPRYTSIARGVEAAGGAVAAGISSTSAPLSVASAINFAFWGLATIGGYIAVRNINDDDSVDTNSAPHENNEIVSSKII